MTIQLIDQPADQEQYAAWLREHPHGNLWQSLERKQYLEALGKEVRIYLAQDNERILASALVMIDRTTFGYSTWDVPRGPVWNANSATAAVRLIEKIVEDAQQEKCLALYCSPVAQLPDTRLPFTASSRFIHAAATRVVDLTQTDSEILQHMKQKGRYNIRVAEKKGVRIEESDDIEAYYALAKQTGERDNYTIVSKQKYAAFLQHVPGAFLLLAYAPDSNDMPIAGLIGVLWDNQAVYYYGASNYAYRSHMAPYALQWSAIQKAKAAGCTTYDLLGVAPPNAEDNHPWQGITSFKEKFGGELITYQPEQMVVLKPWVMKMLEWKRKIL